MVIEMKIMNVTKLVRTLAAVSTAVLTLAPTPSHADFYDGVRGPSKAQVHYTANVGETTTHNLAAKYFGEDVFAVGAVSTNGQSFQESFSGVGYIIEQLDRVKALPVVGYGLSGDGKQGTLNTILQATAFLDSKGTFLADPRYILSLPAHGQDQHTPAHTFGLTPSVGNGQIRVGTDLGYTLGDPHLTASGLLRYDLDTKKHSSWVEIGVGNQGNVQLQFRGNF